MINLSEERILDFLDGRLATPDEEELLHTLAVSPERRQVMREHMKLRELTNSIARQGRFNVPEQVTTQLFSRLEEAGFTPPVTPESLLARAPEAMSMRYAGAAALGAGTVATAVSSGWRFGAISLLAASVMSFVLGAGAYYVFGSTLGLKTHSQEVASMRRSLQHHATPGLASQFAVSQNNADVVSPAGNASTGMVMRTAGAASTNKISSGASIASLFPIGPMEPVMNMGISQDNSSAPSLADNSAASKDNTAPITYTAPKQSPYTLTTNQMRFVNGPAPIWPSVIPSPFADERGTISVRYGTGQALSSTNSPMSSLNEFRFGMTMWNYVLFRASIGQMSSYERTAQLSTAGSTKGQIITSEGSSPNSTTMIGLEAGVTLEPLGIPIDALVGFMYSGGSQYYPQVDGGGPEYSPFCGRASLMAHFEPWKMLEISAGLEGLVYTHYLSGSIAQQERFFSLSPSAVSSQALRSETCGLVGPALEFGWHF
jgi:anti-sigma factor RsiW